MDASYFSPVRAGCFPALWWPPFPEVTALWWPPFPALSCPFGRRSRNISLRWGKSSVRVLSVSSSPPLPSPLRPLSPTISSSSSPHTNAFLFRSVFRGPQSPIHHQHYNLSSIRSSLSLCWLASLRSVKRYVGGLFPCNFPLSYEDLYCRPLWQSWGGWYPWWWWQCSCSLMVSSVFTFLQSWEYLCVFCLLTFNMKK